MYLIVVNLPLGLQQNTILTIKKIKNNNFTKYEIAYGTRYMWYQMLRCVEIVRLVKKALNKITFSGNDTTFVPFYKDIGDFNTHIDLSWIPPP